MDQNTQQTAIEEQTRRNVEAFAKGASVVLTSSHRFKGNKSAALARVLDNVDRYREVKVARIRQLGKAIATAVKQA